MVTAFYQVGGALGLAVVTTIAAGAGTLTDAFQRGLMVAAAFAAVNVVLAIVSPRIAPTPEQLVEAAAA